MLQRKHNPYRNLTDSGLTFNALRPGDSIFDARGNVVGVVSSVDATRLRIRIDGTVEDWIIQREKLWAGTTKLRPSRGACASIRGLTDQCYFSKG